jgi:hypothetical protein
MRHDPTYPERFAEADRACTRMLDDVAFRIARDGVAKLVLHDGKPVIIDGKKHYEIKYETSLLMKLLAARDREKYGEQPVIQIDLKSWDGDISKLNEASTKGLLALLKAEMERQEAEEAAREAARQPVKALPAAVKEKIVKQIAAESEESQRD